MLRINHICGGSDQLKSIFAFSGQVLARSGAFNNNINRNSQSVSSMSSEASITTSSVELWQRLAERYTAAQESSASLMSETKVEFLRDSTVGVDYILRIASNLRDKPKLPNIGGVKKDWKNPFLPPEPELFVGHLSETHSLVLNKYNIVPHHVLIITKEYESQLNPLNDRDFVATWMAMEAMPDGGMAYFNSGPLSGASQPHKHVQVMPLPLAPNSTVCIPFDPCFKTSLGEHHAGQPCLLGRLPFKAWGASLAKKHQSIYENGKALEELYVELLTEVKHGLKENSVTSYNLLMTREYMMIIPRRQEFDGPIGCNSVAFAGSFFVKTAEELQYVKERGPSAILSNVAY